MSWLLLPMLLLCPLLAVAATVDSIPLVSLFEDYPTYAVPITGIGGSFPGQRVRVEASFAPADLFYPPEVVHDGSSTMAIVRVQPRPDANGSATFAVTVTAEDGTGADTITRTAPARVEAVNDPPRFTAPFYIVMVEDETRANQLALELTGLSPGPPDEAGQQLTVVALPVDPTLVEAAVDYVQGASTATIRLRPLPDRFGFTHLVVTVYDDSVSLADNMSARSVMVFVNGVNDPPVLAAKRDLLPTPGNLVAITRDDLRLEDVDNPPPGTLAFVLTAAPAGRLLRDGIELVPGDRFTQDEIDAGRIAYHHGDTGTESIVLTYTDSFIPQPLGPVRVYATPLGLTRPEVVLGSATTAYVEGGTPAGLDAQVVDAHTAVFLGGSLSIALAGQVAGDRLDLPDQGVAAGQVHVDGGRVEVGGVEVGVLTRGGDGASLAVAFTTAAATPASATAVLRAVRFSSTSRAPGASPRILRLVADNGIAAASDAAQVTVEVTPVDDPPAVTTSWVATLPGVTAVWTLAASDPDSAALTWSVAAQPAAGQVAVEDAAAGRFRCEPGRSGSFPLRVAVSDGTSTVAAEIALVVADPDAVAPLPASDPPHEAFAGQLLERRLAFERVSGPLTAILTGEVPSGAVVLPDGADGVLLRWAEPVGSHRRFGVLVVDQGTRAAAHWPLTIRVHPTPGGAQ